MRSSGARVLFLLSFTSFSCLSGDEGGGEEAPDEIGVSAALAPALNAVLDTRLEEKNPDSVYGTTSASAYATTLYAAGNVNGACKLAEAALRFDVSSLAGKQATSATLRVYVTNASTGQFQIFQLLRAWNETSTTWNQWTSGSSWAGGGANGTGDRGTLVRGSFGNITTTGYKDIPLNSDGLALVQGWINNTIANNGILIRPTTSSPCTNAADDFGFSSRETSTPPQLIIDYASTTPTGTTLRLASYNLHKGRGTDGISDITSINRQATTIKNLGSEIVCTPESKYLPNTNLEGALESATGKPWNRASSVSSAIPNGQMILTTFPIVSSQTLLYTTYACDQRAALRAEIQVTSTQRVQVFCTHWDVSYTGCSSGQSYRIAQSNQLKSWAASFAGPKVIMGDLNSSYNATEVTNLSSTTNGAYTNIWSKAVNESKAQAYADNPVAYNTRTIHFDADHIFFYPDGKTITVQSAIVPDTRAPNSGSLVVDKIGTTDDKGVRPSDHNPKAVVISF